MNDARTDDYQELADSSPQVLAAQTLQRKADSSPRVRAAESLQSTVDASPTAGTELPGGVRAKMERAFGADFSAVRVHEGPEASAVGARAYAQGTQIHFAPGQYQPHSQRGQEILGHELAHVVQQAEGRVQPTRQVHGKAVNDDPALEREADARGREAARGPVAEGVTQKLADSAVSTIPAPAASVPLQRDEFEEFKQAHAQTVATNAAELHSILASQIGKNGKPTGPNIDNPNDTALRGVVPKMVKGGGVSKKVYILEDQACILLTGLNKDDIEKEVGMLMQLRKDGYPAPEVYPQTFCVNRSGHLRHAYLMEHIPGFDIPKPGSVAFTNTDIIHFGIKLALHLLGKPTDDIKFKPFTAEWTQWDQIPEDTPVTRTEHQNRARNNLNQIAGKLEQTNEGVPDFQVRFNSETGEVQVLDPSPTGQAPTGQTLNTHRDWVQIWLQATNDPAAFLQWAKQELMKAEARQEKMAKKKETEHKAAKSWDHTFKGV